MNEREIELEQRITNLEEENAKLKEAEHLLVGRTALAWVGMISSSWRHSIEQDAITIKDQILLLRDEIQTDIGTTDINRRLDMIEQLADHILEKPITAPLSSEEGVELIHVTPLITDRIKQLKTKSRYSNVDIKLIESKEIATIRISREWFRRGLDLLIDNSVEAMVNSQIKQLTIRVLARDGQINIEVKDTGHGIPADIIPLLFIQPIPRKQNKRGLGLGLLMAQMIFRTYNGEIHLTETNSEGSIFTISFPRTDEE